MNWADVESRLGVELPRAYKEYVDSLDDLFLEPGVSVESVEPTPFGEAVIDEFIPRSDLELVDVALVPIAVNSFGYRTFLSVHESDYGSVYYYDFEQRALQPDEWFYRRFPNLSSDLAQYLSVRSQGLLPEKPAGNESLYRLASTFSEFAEKMVDLEC